MPQLDHVKPELVGALLTSHGKGQPAVLLTQKDVQAMKHDQKLDPDECATKCPLWLNVRPKSSTCPRMTRRALRALNRGFTMDEVQQHRYKDDAWIVVDGKVYDMTEHILTHPGWDTGSGVSTILSILAHIGMDCTAEFHDIHRSYPVAYKQLKAFYIGDLVE